MICSVIPFPLARRRRMIDRQVRYAAELHSEAAERHIRQQLHVQAEAMRRKGVDEALVRHELGCMELAIRSLLSQTALDAS
jgi:hypothetical protein